MCGPVVGRNIPPHEDNKKEPRGRRNHCKYKNEQSEIMKGLDLNEV
jgi:hypothetical protein